jgi:serine/threonine protein kinase
LVHEPLLVDYESLDEVTLAGDMERDLHRYILKRVIEALDFLHTEAHVVHTGEPSGCGLWAVIILLTKCNADLRSVNVMFTTTDTSVFAEHERKQLLYPPPRKVRANGHIIYKSRPLPVRTSTVFDMLGEPILIDFGHAYIVEESTNLTSWVQPNAYRSPEVVLGLPWSYPADIWNLGAWIWHAVDGTFPFITWSKVIPEYEYDLKIHFLALVHCLGPAPADLIERSKRAETPGFFQDKGELVAALEKVKGKACGLAPFPRLNERAKKMEGKERDDFLSFIWKMLRWRPEERYTAAQLLDDEWLNGEYADSQ